MPAHSRNHDFSSPEVPVPVTASNGGFRHKPSQCYQIRALLMRWSQKNVGMLGDREINRLRRPREGSPLPGPARLNDGMLVAARVAARNKAAFPNPIRCIAHLRKNVLSRPRQGHRRLGSRGRRGGSHSHRPTAP